MPFASNGKVNDVVTQAVIGGSRKQLPAIVGPAPPVRGDGYVR